MSNRPMEMLKPARSSFYRKKGHGRGGTSPDADVKPIKNWKATSTNGPKKIPQTMANRSSQFVCDLCKSMCKIRGDGNEGLLYARLTSDLGIFVESGCFLSHDADFSQTVWFHGWRLRSWFVGF